MYGCVRVRVEALEVALQRGAEAHRLAVDAAEGGRDREREADVLPALDVPRRLQEQRAREDLREHGARDRRGDGAPLSHRAP
jgi:hypothetical protein